MASEFVILGIAGSLRKDSYNRAALRAVPELLPPQTRLETCEIGGLPLYNQDDEDEPPQEVRDLKARIRAADAILLVTPEYNYSVPGVLKNAIDWASRPSGDSAWKGKAVAVMGASIGALGSARAQYHLRQCFVFLDMHAVTQPEVMIANAAERFDSTGRLKDETSRKLIRDLLIALVALARCKPE